MELEVAELYEVEEGFWVGVCYGHWNDRQKGGFYRVFEIARHGAQTNAQDGSTSN